MRRAAGRQTSRLLNAGALAQSFVYYGWTEKVAQVGQGGRLKDILAKAGSNNLRNLPYTDDPIFYIASLVKVAHRGDAFRKAQTLQPLPPGMPGGATTLSGMCASPCACR